MGNKKRRISEPVQPASPSPPPVVPAFVSGSNLAGPPKKRFATESDMLAFADEAAQSQQTKVDSKRQRMAKWKPEVESKADTGKRKKGESAVMKNAKRQVKERTKEKRKERTGKTTSALKSASSTTAKGKKRVAFA